MKSVTAVIQQTLYLFLQNSNYCHYWQNTTHLLLFIGLGFANYLTFSECLGMILQDNTHVCYYHWGFQAMIQSWVLCVWTDQLRAKTHEIRHERQTHSHDSANKAQLMNMNMTTKKQPCDLWIMDGNCTVVWFWFFYFNHPFMVLKCFKSSQYF